MYERTSNIIWQHQSVLGLSIEQFLDIISEPLSVVGLAQSNTDGGQNAELATDVDSITCSQTMVEPTHC